MIERTKMNERLPGMTSSKRKVTWDDFKQDVVICQSITKEKTVKKIKETFNFHQIEGQPATNH